MEVVEKAWPDEGELGACSEGFEQDAFSTKTGIRGAGAEWPVAPARGIASNTGAASETAGPVADTCETYAQPIALSFSPLPVSPCHTRAYHGLWEMRRLNTKKEGKKKWSRFPLGKPPT